MLALYAMLAYGTVATNKAKKAQRTLRDTLEDSGALQKSRETWKEWTGSKPFVYDELPTTTSIRLIKIDSSSGKTDKEVRLTLRTVELERRPRYHALSYTWAQQRSLPRTIARTIFDWLTSVDRDRTVPYDLPTEVKQPRPSKTVICNGVRMRVFDNVFDALKRLRDKLPGEWFWIDAVSINQQDDDEKTQQVRLMGQIYELAQSVVVWFGELNEEYGRGLGLLEEMAQSDKALPPNPLFSSTSDDRDDNDSESTKAQEAHQQLCLAAITALHLIRRVWFRRVWVVQELCLAQKAIFLHGEHEVSIEALYTACVWCFGNSQGLGSRLSTLTRLRAKILPYLTAHMQLLPMTMDARREFNNGNKWTLLQWYHVCLGRQATQAKDYVFAGLALIKPESLSINPALQPVIQAPPLPRRRPPHLDGVTTEAETSTKDQDASLVNTLLPQGLWPELTPDYSVSDLEVYINATACLLTHESLESVFKLAFRLRKIYNFFDFTDVFTLEQGAIQGAPSWVLAPGSFMSGSTIGLIKTGMQSPWKAWLHDEDPALNINNPIISPDGRTLTVDAAYVDAIESDLAIGDRYDRPDGLLRLIRFLLEQPLWYSPNYAAANIIGSGGVHPAGKLTLFEVVAYSMVAGHINGQRITHREAQMWLAESLESYVRLRIAEEQVGLSSSYEEMELLETAGFGPAVVGDRKLRKADAKKVARHQLEQRDALRHQNLIVELISSLNMLKEKYAHLSWPGEAVAPVSAEEAAAIACQEVSITPTASIAPLELLPEQRPDEDIWARFSKAITTGGKQTKVYERSGFLRPVSDECRRFEEVSMQVMAYRKFTMTKHGFVGSCPIWVPPEAQVFLVPGCSTPFVFLSKAVELACKIEAMRDKMGETETSTTYNKEVPETDEKVPTEAELREIEEQLRLIQQEAGGRHFLSGDAYFEGIMQGELMGKLKLERLNIG